MTRKQKPRGTYDELKLELSRGCAEKRHILMRRGMSPEEAAEKASEWHQKKLKEAQLLYFGMEI